jgi:hypothetical protein
MMSPEEIEKRKEWVLENCTCMSCPSWVECDEEGGFCFQTIGKSRCIKEEKGCICGGCPVYDKLELKHLYFCTKGSEQEQSGM